MGEYKKNISSILCHKFMQVHFDKTVIMIYVLEWSGRILWDFAHIRHIRK